MLEILVSTDFLTKKLLNHGLFQLVNKCNLIDDDSIKRLT
jgi:hypothetical protein